MINSSLDKRLLSCADYVRAGAVFADIGTDHGYLPIFLLKSGKIRRAVLSDVNEGPLASAVSNVKEAGLEGACEFILTDGAAALSGRGITDYAICGMGGELISRIIDSAPHLKEKGVRLILQPMTKQAHLRAYLAKAGFEILSERFSFADGKYYVTILSEYTGESYLIDEATAELGKNMPHEADRAEYLGYLSAKERSISRALEGKRMGGIEVFGDLSLLDSIRQRIRILTEG